MAAAQTRRKQMKTLTKLEELAQILLSIYLFSLLPFAWWIYPVLFFAPDLSMIGLLASKRTGAILYNLFHHKAIGLCAYILGSLAGIPLLSLTGAVMFGHSSFDRVWGFALLDPSPPNQTPVVPAGWKA
jgi:Domain of unknown function (DUF4260)